MSKLIKIVTSASFLLVITVFITWQLSLPNKLTLRFYPYVGDQPLVLHDKTYPNPGGEGDFSIRDFQFFISNLILESKQNSFQEQESYHLARFDGSQPYYEIVIPDIAINSFEQLIFWVGVDPKANSTIVIAGDLDPNSRMAWNWQVGYKFLLLEGSLLTKDTQIPLVYHIGFDESYTQLSFPLNDKSLSSDGVMNLKVDVIALFNQSNAIDMNNMSHVKFAPKDVARIAKGFKTFISVL